MQSSEASRVAVGAPRRSSHVVLCPHYRVVDRWDLVPGVPPPAPGGYAHGGDPRLLDARWPNSALRRDRDWLARLAVYAWSFLLWPLTRRISTIDDHMIWTYRERLEGIARARS